MYRKILLPTDGSGYAEDEVKRATKLLSEGGEIIVLSVAGKLTSSAFQSRSNVKKVNRGLYQEAEENVEHMKDLFDESVNVRGMVVVGFPAETIKKVAEEEKVDLIIISASGKSGLHRFVLGSVAEKVLKNSEIDVLLVPNK
ncbi:universal stress protein [Methanobrevibacter sp.]|uniref:universal stress protein n=1 Tax=Methanobrevibacter sp. TaxID=66852 RepID=UPI0026DFE99F|nr:universal stress protein [Methanobrevibacter sp.]MDO5859577.1 universal stress protein [Methanobrevibacter sp.]